MRAILIAAIGLTLLAGCKSTRQTETSVVSNEKAVVERMDTVVTRDTVKIVETSRDSVIVQTRGDSVYVDRWHIRYKERDAVSKAAEVKIMRDTVMKYVEKTKTVAEKPKKNKLWHYIAGVAAIALAALAVYMLLMLNKKNSNK